ncbi:MAG TPA: nicotinate-nucleotide adenylyltransferase [Pyrinomonadaceae bacterium]|nr:nicotinate-nucleotide adenylyltransferase [Pyrinomonadaceae bacterium]
MKQRRVGLYGGTFDPVHAGHIAVARALVEVFAFDEVLFIPAHIAPHKRTTVRRQPASPLHRYAMLVLATMDEPRFKVSTIELDAPERPYTVETLARLRAEFGASARLFFVMGADSWADITTWREWQRLLALTDQIVVTRPGYTLSTGHVTDEVQRRIVDLRGRGRAEVAAALEALTDEVRIYFTDAVSSDVSATTIRQLTQASKTNAAAELLVPSAVAEYIRKYRVYRNTHDSERNNVEDQPAHDD